MSKLGRLYLILNQMMKHFTDFDLYSRALIESEDVDPVYPFIKKLFAEYDVTDIKQKQWFIFLYVSFYSLHSGLEMIDEFPYPKDFNEDSFLRVRVNKPINQFGIERRGSLRNPLNQLQQLLAAKDIIERQDFDFSSNAAFRSRISKMPYQGEWASFKIAELFEKALDYDDLTIHDLGIDGKDPNSNDGPIGGLRWLFGRDYDGLQYDESMKPVWNKFGTNLAKNWGVDVGKVETCFCKWHKMCSGKYYVGHDIHEFAHLHHFLGNSRYERVMSAFDCRIWSGVDGILKNEKKAYKTSGKIINAEFARKLPKIDVRKIMIETMEEF